jgi:hypothetical protein
MAGRRPGTVPKGDRSAITVRVPRAHRFVYEDEASKLGMALSDYLGLLLARTHGLEDPEYVHRGRNLDQVQLRSGA